MHSLSIQFQNASYWLFAAVAIAAMILYFSFRNVRNQSKGIYIVLILLRSLLIFGIFLLLIQPIISWQRDREQKPVILLFVDNSQSITAHKNCSADSLRLVVSDLKKQIETNDGQVKILPFDLAGGDEIDDPGSLQFDRAGTDISSIFRYADKSEESGNVRAAVLISDGVSTAGEDPLLSRNLPPYPVHTLGIGDSLMIMDPSVVEMMMPSRATVGDSVVVEARVLPLGFGKPTTVWLKKADQIIQKKTIPSYQKSLIQTVRFNIVPENAGIIPYSVMIDTIDDRNPANNARKSLLRVSEKMKRFVAIQTRLGFDSRYFYQQLKKLPELEVVTLLGYQGKWQGQDPDNLFQMKWDAVALLGFPSRDISREQLSVVADKIRRDEPVLYIQYAPGQDIAALNQMIGESIPDYRLAREGGLSVSSKISEDNRHHPVLMNLLAVSGHQNDWANLPPIGMPFQEIRLDDSFRPLIITDDQKPLPIVSLGESGGIRRALVTGTDLWRWDMLTLGADNHYIYADFMHSLIKWLSDTLSTSNLQFSLSKEIFLKGELAEVTGIVTNVDGGIIPDAVIEAELIDERNNSVNFLIQWDGIKYRGNAQLENEGNHHIRIHASQGDRMLGEIQMALEVLPNSVEHQIIRQNVETLKGIANRTGGHYFTYANYPDITGHISFEKDRITSSHKIRLWRWSGILIIILLLAISEWVIRRISGYQ